MKDTPLLVHRSLGLNRQMIVDVSLIATAIRLLSRSSRFREEEPSRHTDGSLGKKQISRHGLNGIMTVYGQGPPEGLQRRRNRMRKLLGKEKK